MKNQWLVHLRTVRKFFAYITKRIIKNIVGLSLREMVQLPIRKNVFVHIGRW